MSLIFLQKVEGWISKNYPELIVLSAWGFFFLTLCIDQLQGCETVFFFIACGATKMCFPDTGRERGVYHEQEMLRRSTGGYQSEASKYPFASAGSFNNFGERSAPTDYYYPSTPTNQTFGFSSPSHSSWQDTTPRSYSYEYSSSNYHSSSTFSSFNIDEHKITTFDH